MLDNETKRRIDTARNILVGKVPDPKSQVEQITIALIYKFMNDMDAVAEELGGSRTFFSGEFERYSWNNLMAPGMGGYDVLILYAEAIQKMDFNPNIPTLFRDIFKNAFLPYRDPQTLKMFLKVINDFSYDHSEKLGDSFEYLLSVLGSQGDAGQFRTPRHIIEFMVDVVNPQKDDTILDPACGTAGFLISAYKHILKTNTKKGKTGDALTPDERTTLAENIRGYDISPDMVRLSLVNLYLHGFQTPNIFEYDTLASQDRWNEYADVILANPPFMSPNGGIRPHKRFSVQSKRSEVLFVDYMCEHLTPNGQAGIIVPEGIIFQSSNAYKQLREMLVKNYLYAVVSLPAGVFQPYAGVKTSILLIDKKLAKRIDKILFVKIKNDGFNLGAQRRPIEKNDLPKAIELITNYKKQIANGENPDIENFKNALLVEKDKIAESGDWNLSGERYKEYEVIKTEWDLVELGEICELKYGKSLKKDNRVTGKYPVYGSNGIVGYHNDFIVKAPFIVVGRKGSAGEVVFSEKHGFPIDTTFYIERDIDSKFNIKYLYHILKDDILKNLNTQAGVPGLNRNDAYKIKIPLPPLEIQKEIVAEIEGYQKIINGAKAVVENYKPQIQINLEWEMVELGEVARFIDYRGKTPKKTTHGIPLITAKNVKFGYINKEPKEFIAEEDFDKWMTRGIPQKGNVLFTTEAPLGNIAQINTYNRIALAQRIITFIPDRKRLIDKFLLFILLTDFMQDRIISYRTGSTVYGIKAKILKKVKIPLPPLEIQKEIVNRIEKEQELVNANTELIKIFEQKIKSRIARVSGE